MSDKEPQNPAIVWFRQDLRLKDNPALVYAMERQKPIVPIFILDEISEGVRPMGSAQKWWLHHSLESLARSLQVIGVQLIIRAGAAATIIDELATQTGADLICWNRRYGEGEQSVDKAIKAGFDGEAKSFAGMLMHEPSLVRTGSDKPYKVYSPFWKKFSSGPQPRLPLPAPTKLTAHADPVPSEKLEDWHLVPTNPNWAESIAALWTPGEPGAAANIEKFLNGNIDHYSSARDLPAQDQTSKLSPHLRFGEVSPHQLWHLSLGRTGDSDSREKWRKELVWREFSYHLLQEWPHLATENFNQKFDNFPWEDNADYLRAWQSGQTGYPIIDAGMRQLWQTGWMHNRVRMIVGSFLVKHLLLDWRHGERWFWDTLVDGDPAANTAQWQWIAGTGADAAPYFRIFNPILQAEKFDKDGAYIKRYVPELAALPSQYLPAPWEAPSSELEQAGVRLGETYPNPIVDHKTARERALDALQSTREPD